MDKVDKYFSGTMMEARRMFEPIAAAEDEDSDSDNASKDESEDGDEDED